MASTPCGFASRGPDRLARALEAGADRHGNELVDVAIVCTPKPDAIAAAAEAVAPGGTLCLYAPPAPDAPPRLDGTTLFLRELTITASYSAGPSDMRASLELIAGGEVDPTPLISHRLPLEQTATRAEPAAPGRGAESRGHPLRAAILHGPEDLRVEEVPEPMARWSWRSRRPRAAAPT